MKTRGRPCVGKKTFACENCGKVVVVPNYSTARFCGRTCAGIVRARNREGENYRKAISLLEGGMTQAEVARQLNLTRARIGHFLRRKGLEYEPIKIDNPNDTSITLSIPSAHKEWLIENGGIAEIVRRLIKEEIDRND